MVPPPRSVSALCALVALAVLTLVSAAPARAQIIDRDPLVVAAGDIACDPEDSAFNGGLGTASRCRQAATAEVALGLDPDVVLALGDIQYEDGAAWKYLRSYDPSWGQLKEITRPAIGNHEYFENSEASGYFDYFNGAGSFGGPAGDRDKGYYSFDLGSWHVVALNTMCSQAGGCGPDSPQARWLRADLAASQSPCTLAYFHHPLLVSGGTGWPSIGHLWRVLQDAGVEVALAGHAHHYERFGRLDHTGAPGGEHGIRHFIVGTGGKSLSNKRDAPLSESMTTSTYGVLALNLRPGRYDWRFVRESGDIYTDAGSEACHAPPPPQPPEVGTGVAGSVRGTTARLTGSVDPRNQETTYHFEYGRTPEYGSRTPEFALGADPGRRPVAARIRGLKRKRVYHYRVVATSPAGTTYGENRTLRADKRSRYADVIDRTPGLLAHWRLGEDRGALAFDSTGRGVGEYAGAHRLDRRGALVKDRDRAAGFDGRSGSVRLDTPVLETRATIEGWFRWSDGDVLLRDDSSVGGWYVRQSRDRLAYRFGGTVFRTRRPISFVRDGAWHHVVVTKDGDAVRLFLDGRLVHSGFGRGGPSPTMPWHVMRNGPFAAHSEGLADDIAFYDRPLSSRTVRAHYRAGVRRRAPNTRLDGPSGPVNDPTPLVRIGATKRRYAVRCALTGPAGGRPEMTPCSTRERLGELADGSYTFRAYTISRRGHPDPKPALTRFRVDTVTPEMDVEVDEPSPRRLERFGMLTRVTCSETCAARVRLVVDGPTARRLGIGRRETEIGRASGRVGPGTGAVRARVSGLPRRARKRLARAGRVPVTVRFSVADLAGNGRGIRRDVVLRR